MSAFHQIWSALCFAIIVCWMKCFSVAVIGQIPQQPYKDCPDRCSCYNRMSTVDCRESGLYTVPILPNTTTHLYLQANKLHHLAHYAFHFAPDLHVLNLRQNTLTVMDMFAFAGLHHLEHIDLRHNRIAFVKLTSISDSILERLRDIDLSDNRLQRIPENMSYFAPNLQSLNLSSNHISSAQMDISYASMIRLQRLDLSANRIRRLTADHLDSIRSLPLRSLAMSGCSLAEISSDAFTNLINLTSLTLADNPISAGQLNGALAGLGPDNHLISLNLNAIPLINVSANMFESLLRLESLSMSACFIRVFDEGIFNLLADLRVVHLQDNNLASIQNLNSAVYLHHIDLSNNSLTTVNVSGLNHLEQLDLSNNYISTIPRHFITNATNLRMLSLQHNLISQISPNAFSYVNILHLDLSYNRLVIFDSWGSFSCDTVDISHNTVTVVTPAAFRAVSVSLRHLNLSYNNISFFNESHSFPNMGQLRRLDLSYNKLGNSRDDISSRQGSDIMDASMLCSGLNSLQILDLSANNISFLDASTTHAVKHLTALYLRHNSIVDVLALRLDKLPSLLQLDLSANRISALDAHALLALDYLQAVDLAYNPFVCNCALVPFQRWLNRTRVTVLGFADRIQYRCTDPSSKEIDISLTLYRPRPESCVPRLHDVRWDLTLFAITVASVLVATALSTLCVYCSRICQCMKALHYRWQVRYREVSAVEFHQDQKV